MLSGRRCFALGLPLACDGAGGCRLVLGLGWLVGVFLPEDTREFTLEPPRELAREASLDCVREAGRECEGVDARECECELARFLLASSLARCSIT